MLIVAPSCPPTVQCDHRKIRKSGRQARVEPAKPLLFLASVTLVSGDIPIS